MFSTTNDDVRGVMIGTLFGFLLVAGFCTMLYVAAKAGYVAIRMVAGARRRQRKFEAEQRSFHSMSGRN